MPLIAILSGCSADTGEGPDSPDYTPGEMVRSSVVIRQATSAAESNELIHSWWIAFVAPDNHIEKIIERQLPTPTDDDLAEFSIPAGRYTIVGFANNIPVADEEGAYVYRHGDATLTFKEGSQSPVTSENAATLMYADMTPESWEGGTLTPMSALESVEITGKNNEHIDVEMARLVAKIEISFENVGKRDIVINSVRIGSFKSDNVALFPDYACLGSTPSLPFGAKMLDMTRDTHGLTLVPEAKGRDIFYSRESTAAGMPNGVYAIFVNVTHKEGLGWNETTDEVSALLTDIAYANRNDHIIIPLQISDYLIGLEANFYPPIGGYPAVVTEAGNGNYYVKFGSMGVFTIRPHVRKAVALDDPDYGELSNTFLDMEIFDISGDDIYVQKPVLDANRDIIGQLGAGKGTSKVTLHFKMPQKDGSTLRYSRTILIIRE